MKKLMTILAVSCALCAAAADAWAGKLPDWHDPQIVEDNREPMTATTFKKWGAAESYDLCLNATKLGIDGCADLVVAAIEKME